MRKVLTVVGARPQFIKAAVVSPVLRQVVEEVLVHTGQHYDRMMSQVFFQELPIPAPDYELGVGSGSHGIATGRMLAALDPIISREMPSLVVVYGDTNSTLAGALAAAKQGVPVAHVEAGLRSFNRAMPEEINRVLTDHLATRLYCPTPRAVKNLTQEGIVQGVVLTGDVMDVAVGRMALDPRAPERFQLARGQYAVATVHRQENADNRERLAGILRGLANLPWPVLLPLHPRTRERIERFSLKEWLGPKIRAVDPLGYHDMLSLVAAAAAVLTDSGGLQREAAALAVPTYVLRQETEWTELVEEGRCVLVGQDPDRIARAVLAKESRPRAGSVMGDPVGRIVSDIVDWGRRT